MHVVPDLGVGGLPKVVVTLCKGIDRSRFHVSVLCLWARGELAEELERAGIPVLLVEQTEKTDYLACLKVRRVLRDERVDVVHTHNTHAFIDGALGAVLSGIRRIVHTEHGRAFPDTRRLMLAEHLLSYATHRFVGVSKETVEDVVRYERIPRRKVVMIPNGVDGAPFRCSIDAAAKRSELGLPDEGPILGVGARLVPEKGLEDLIEAVRLLRTGFPTLRLLIAGSGPLEDSLQQLAQQRGVAEAVHFLGVRHDMPELLRLFDVYVLSSLREGLPMGLLEAMAAECPVVATQVGGIPSVIEDGVNGLLAPARDPQALAAAVERLLVDKALRSSFSERSRALFDRKYGVEQMVRRYEALYLESAPRGALTSR